jgi:mono/diheme cytochrome c family protein
MAEPVPYGAFAPNPNFPDGKTLREPAPGTVARGHLPLHYRPTPEDAIRAGKELHSPFRATDTQARARGARVFADYCQVCHGLQGKGDGPVTKRGVPPPPSLVDGKSREMKDGQLFHILTYGQGNMPSYAAQLSREDRWQAILHVRSFQQAAPARGEKRP